MRKSVEKLVLTILTLMFLIGITGVLSVFICSEVSNAGMRFLSSSIRFPLNVSNYDVGCHGHVVCFINSHNRIQVYSEDGQFLKGWFVDNGHKTAGSVLIDPNDLIHFATPADRHFVFDFDGTIVKDSYSKDIGDSLTELKLEKHKSSQSYTGFHYKALSGIKGKRIIKISPEGKESVVVSDPFFVWLFQQWFPLLFFLFFPMLYFSLVIKKEYRDYLKIGGKVIIPRERSG